VLRDLQRVQFSDGSETGTFSVDVDRFELVMKRIAAGLFYKHTGFRFSTLDDLTVVSPDLRFASSFEAPYEAIVPFVERPLGWQLFSNSGPRVFECYYLGDRQRWKNCAFKMRFYESMRVYVISSGDLWLGSWLDVGR